LIIRINERRINQLMDSEKLLRILTDLKSEEAEFAISSRLVEISNQLAANNQNGFIQAEDLSNALIDELKEKSIIASYSPSEISFLKKINGNIYFGNGLIQELENIFGFKPYEIASTFLEFNNSRQTYLNQINILLEAMKNIGIKEYRPENYEVGIVFPSEYTDIVDILKRLNEFQRLISAVIEGTTGKHQEVKITRLSNGTLDFFSPQNKDIALQVVNLLANLAQIWTTIQSINQKKANTQNDEILSDAAKAEISSALEHEAERIKKEIIETLPSKILEKFDGHRKHELAKQIKVSINAVFLWFHIGIEVDVTPVRLPETEEKSTTDKELSETINRTNQNLQNIYTLPAELKKLPFELNYSDFGLDEEEVDSNIISSGNQELSNDSGEMEETEKSDKALKSEKEKKI
jgi:hypothetical protein